LLPKFLELIGKRKPAIVFGEQVAGAIRWGWLDQAFGDLEKFGYACGAAVLPAIAFGARHERKRLYWVADSRCQGRTGCNAVESISIANTPTFTEYGDPLADAGKVLDGDISGLLLGDGLSVVLERAKVRGYGNAIVPQVAAAFIRAAAA
jgi:DNA (cytosine-5)-methyltransferase 1